AGSEEALEQARLLVLRDSRALVGDADAHESFAGRRRDRDRRALRRVLAGVGDEVREDLRGPPRLGEHPVGVGVEIDREVLLVRVDERLEEDERLLEARPDARGYGADLKGAGLDAAGVEQVVDEMLEPERAATQ